MKYEQIAQNCFYDKDSLSPEMVELNARTLRRMASTKY